MLIGLDANEANVKNRVGSNQFAFQVLWQLFKQDKTNSYRIYLQNPPLKTLPPAGPRWQYQVLTPKFLWTQWRLPLSLYLHRPRPDIFLTLGHYAPRFSPVPTLICIMDLAYLKFPQTYLKTDLFKLKCWTKYSAKKAAHIFTISQASRQDIHRHYHIPLKKITVAYPAVSRPPSKSGSKLSVSSKSAYLLYLGTLQPRKNLLNLVKAFSQLADDHPQLKLVIAGKKGWLYQSLFGLVNQLKLAKKVIFTGFVPSPQLQPLIQQAQALILPSLYEGFGIPVVQAMTLGTPVIVSRNSSLTEIVGSAGTYIQSPFGAEQIKQGIIEALSIKPAQQAQLLSAAKTRVKQFSWRKTGQKILEVINEINL